MQVPSLGDVFLITAITSTTFVIEVGLFVALGLF